MRSKPAKYVALSGTAVVAIGQRLSSVRRAVELAQEQWPDMSWKLYERAAAGPLGIARREIHPVQGKWEIEKS